MQKQLDTGLDTGKVAIALGGNIGDSSAILKAALTTLDTIPGIQLEAQSSWYVTKPVGPAQPDYLNSCAILRTKMSPHELLEILLLTEAKFGRVRKQRWGERSLDLDLLLYDDLIIDTPTLQIPHPRMTQRAFVLIPLAEIAPRWIEPISGCAVQDFLCKVDSYGVKLLDSN